MSTRPVPPRRIVPPAMPAPSDKARARVAYTPPVYEDDSRPRAMRVIGASVLVGALAVGGFFAFRALRPAAGGEGGGAGADVGVPSTATTQDIAGAQTASAQQGQEQRHQGEHDAAAAGWVGVLDLPAERAVITIATLDNSSGVARKFAYDVELPLSLAAISIDNSAGTTEVAVDPTGATLHMLDGTSRAALDAMQVLAAVKTDRAATQKSLSPPFRCRPGERQSGKLLLMPPGVEPKSIAAVTLHINRHPQQIKGRFMDETEKAKMRQSGAYRVGGS